MAYKNNFLTGITELLVLTILNEKGDSYVYVRNVNGDKTTKPFLNVTSVWGDIELN